MCSFLSPPLCIYRREPRLREASSAANPWRTDLSIQLAFSTCQVYIGGAHGQVGRPAGRPASLWAHRPSLLVCGLLPGPTCQWHGDWLLLCWFLALVGPLIHVLTHVASRFAGTSCLGSFLTIMLQNWLKITCTHFRTSSVEFVSK